MNLLSKLHIILYIFTSRILGALICRPEGHVLPKPSTLANSPIFQAAITNITTSLDAAISGTINAGWPVSNVSFSLAVISSTSQTDPGIPLWEYHHLASGNTRGTKNIDRHSQYLIGSITKVISDYILLRSGVDIDLPVTRFLPQLRSGKSVLVWKDVTLRMLAEHLAGVSANCK